MHSDPNVNPRKPQMHSLSCSELLSYQFWLVLENPEAVGRLGQALSELGGKALFAFSGRAALGSAIFPRISVGLGRKPNRISSFSWESPLTSQTPGVVLGWCEPVPTVIHDETWAPRLTFCPCQDMRSQPRNLHKPLAMNNKIYAAVNWNWSNKWPCCRKISILHFVNSCLSQRKLKFYLNEDSTGEKWVRRPEGAA